MNNKNIPTLLGTAVLIVIAITAGAFVWAYEKKQAPIDPAIRQQAIPKPAAQTNAKPSTPAPEKTATKTYAVEKYGFAFEFPETLEVAPKSTDDTIILNDPTSGHWMYEIKTSINADNLSLKDAFQKALKKFIAPENLTAAKAYEGTLHGHTVRKFSDKNYSDYGNAGVVLLNGKHIVEILGDDSTPENNARFEALLTSFKFAD
jgi:hypothetical protein